MAAEDKAGEEGEGRDVSVKGKLPKRNTKQKSNQTKQKKKIIPRDAESRKTRGRSDMRRGGSRRAHTHTSAGDLSGSLELPLLRRYGINPQETAYIGRGRGQAGSSI